jgi:hypothetical protein
MRGEGGRGKGEERRENTEERRRWDGLAPSHQLEEDDDCDCSLKRDKKYCGHRDIIILIECDSLFSSI